LELDLSTFTTAATLTLIKNQTTDAIIGFFERGSTGDLYEEGAAVLNTGYNGTVNISYVGGTGNDVVLNLIAAAIEDPDFDGDGDVDGADFLTWQRGLGISSGASRSQGDADGDGAIDGDDLNIWKGQFASLESASVAVPEPHMLAFWITLSVAAGLKRRFRNVASAR
jgi:hypothetical protein